VARCSRQLMSLSSITVRSGEGLKERGNKAFKAGDLETALELYDRASGEFREQAVPTCAALPLAPLR